MRFFVSEFQEPGWLVVGTEEATKQAKKQAKKQSGFCTRPCTHAVHSGPSMQSGQCRQPAQGFEACPCQGLLSVIMHNNNELRMKFELSFTVHSPSIHSVFMHAQFRGCIQLLVPRNFPSCPVHVASRSAQLF